MTPQMCNSQRRPIHEGPALLALLITASVLAGCAVLCKQGIIYRIVGT